MKNYIDQALAVCDALIAQAKINQQTYGSIFASVSEHDERVRLKNNIEMDFAEHGDGRADLIEEMKESRQLLEKNLKPNQLRHFRSLQNDHDEKAFLRTLSPEQRLNYDEWRSQAAVVAISVDMSTPEASAAHVEEQLHSANTKNMQRLTTAIPRIVSDPVMVDCIIFEALERAGFCKETDDYEIHFDHGEVLLDAYPKAMPLDLLALRKDIDTNIRAELSDKNKWTKIQGSRQVSYVMKLSSTVSAHSILQSYAEDPGAAVQVELIKNQHSMPSVWVRGNESIQKLLNDGFNLQIELPSSSRRRSK